jgi:hypothetical protein
MNHAGSREEHSGLDPKHENLTVANARTFHNHIAVII